jgi:ribosome maturation factor RimP
MYMTKIKDKIATIMKDMDFALYDVIEANEDGKPLVRVLIDSADFITIDDCVFVSRTLGEAFDKEDLYEGEYLLEVASAGAEHELRNEEEIKRSIGKHVHIETYDQTFEGKLIEVSPELLTIEMKQKKIKRIQLLDVKFIRQAIVF